MAMYSVVVFIRILCPLRSYSLSSFRMHSSIFVGFVLHWNTHLIKAAWIFLFFYHKNWKLFGTKHVAADKDFKLSLSVLANIAGKGPRESKGFFGGNL